MEFWLYDHGENRQRTIQLDAEALTIGRESTCDIVLHGPFVARRHARIQREGNRFYVQNLSRNGTRVAGHELAKDEQRILDFGDEIQLAQFSLAMLRPEGTGGRKPGDDRRALQQRLMDFEQHVHATLLERMNLRVTGGTGKTDDSYRRQILSHLDGILTEQLTGLDADLLSHAVYTHLHRLVIAEVVRQCQGQIQTEYRAADERLLEERKEQQITELVTSLVDQLPLLFEPGSVGEDLTVAEEAFEDQFQATYKSMPPELKRYVVRRTLAKDIQDIMFGLGPLQDLVDMANVSEIMVVGPDRIYVEKNGVVQSTTRSFFSEEVLMGVIERILTPVGRRVDQSSPLVDARLADGSRVNVIIPPLALVGPCLTIRKFGWIPFTIEDLISRGALSDTCAEFLQACVVGRKNMIISGGTGSGKTTLLNTLSAYARPSERIITIEESAEMQLPQPHVVRLEGRPSNVEGKGAFTIRELVRNALRMRPDRVIVGEVRGAEALDMLQAMNTGHDGSLSTLHANAPSEAMQRLETLVLMAVEMPVRAIREQIAAAIDIVVQVTRFPSGNRRVTRITEVTEIDPESGRVRTEDVFTLAEEKQARLRHTGYIPRFTETLIEQNHLDVKVFL